MISCGASEGIVSRTAAGAAGTGLGPREAMVENLFSPFKLLELDTVFKRGDATRLGVDEGLDRPLRDP